MIAIDLFDRTESVATMQGVTAIPMPSALDGKVLVEALATVTTKGSGSGSTQIGLRRRRNGSEVQMLSSNLALGDAYWSNTATVDATNSIVETGDELFVDVTNVHSVAPMGLSIALTFTRYV